MRAGEEARLIARMTSAQEALAARTLELQEMFNVQVGFQSGQL
jgi:hypothetical protein